MNKFDWTKWSAIAEVLSAVAIVVTLAYLAVQTRYVREQTELQVEQNKQNIELLRQNTDMLEAQGRSNLAERRVGFNEMLVTNPDLLELLFRASDGDQLTQAEEYQILALGARVFSSWSSQFIEVAEGAITCESLPVVTWRAVFRGLQGIDLQLSRTWEVWKLGASRDFVLFMEENVVREEGSSNDCG